MTKTLGIVAFASLFASLVVVGACATPDVDSPASPPVSTTTPVTTGTGLPADDTTRQIVVATNAFLGMLTDEMLAVTLFEFDDENQRSNWSNLPTGAYDRAGLRMGDLSRAQIDALGEIFSTTLSEEGMNQIIENVAGDEVLRTQENNRRLVFGEDEYYFSILGTPSETEPWMWQFGGHHLAVNATIVGGSISLAPTLTGGQPVHYVNTNGEEVQQLDLEYTRAFELINALNDEQQDTAIQSSNPINLILGPGEDDASTPSPQGIQSTELDTSQRAQLLELIESRVGLLNTEDAQIALAEIELNLDDTWFAWYGSTTLGEGAYYRIQGPTVWIEYAPQEMGGSLVDHTHAIYRNLSDDYARSLWDN